MQVRLAQVPRWEGSGATHSRRDRRHYGGNKRGRERRLLREFAEPPLPPSYVIAATGRTGRPPARAPGPAARAPLGSGAGWR